MRLAAFKAHGFKSFADTVNFKVGGELTGVVGPNGCGKSNIVDAVRWVLGESRASSLRGSTLSDVMFNGSERRNPADWCEVELRFENTNAGSGDSAGMWSSYPEIIVRRELARDGRQSYTINGSAVRRRDVIDLFRGTGVAPRAYGVVEQGMVTEIAEASPEELRVFMEEAAGVSHYKERRRESERRLDASNENLAQLSLVLDGVRKRVESLKRQARTARRHRELGEEINHLDALLILARRGAAAQALSESRARLEEMSENVRALQEKIVALKEESDGKKQARGSVDERVDEAQAQLAEAQKMVTAAEHGMQNATQGKDAARARLKEAQQELEVLGEQEQQLVQSTAALEQQLAKLQGDIAEGAGAADAEANELARLQIGRESAQREADGVREQLATAERQLEAARVRGQMLAERMADGEQRLEATREALEVLPPADGGGDEAPPDEGAVENAAQTLEETRARHEVQQQAAMDADAEVRRLESDIATVTAQVDTLNAMLREDSWEDGGARLSQVLQVDAGEWSRALDAALGVYAGAHTVDDIAAYVGSGDMPPAGAAVVELQPAAVQNPANNTGLPTLLEKLTVPDARRQVLEYWLSGVYVADDDAAAAAARGRLGRHESVVTRGGAVYGAHSLLVSGETQGGYDWQQRMSELQQQQQRQQDSISMARAAHEQARAAVEALQQEMAGCEQALAAARQTLAEQRIEYNRRMERQRAQQQRRQELEQELTALEDAQRQLQDDETLQAGEIAQLEQTHSDCTVAFDKRRQTLDAAGAALESYREIVQEASIKRHGLERQVEEIGRRQVENENRKRENNERRMLLARRVQQFDMEVHNHDEQALKQALSDAKSRMVECEAEAAAARAARQAVEGEATRIADALESARGSLEAAQAKQAEERVQERELVVKVNYLNDALEELELSPEKLKALAAEEVGDVEQREASIEELRGKRDRLGAINFMADSELRESETQLTELNAQKTDIETAIEELRSAIRRIDNETKTRLQEMFDAVNREFSVLYQRMFDGGEARLEMVGDTILESGFELKVRPPGKRMFPVRMLSGGEKAASAASFIFSILRLNPPPFCILDEVDAPLDENRSQRFVALLEDISKTVQCLVVSHNKSTISSMPRLIGVTQEEAGISKIVSVTLNDALRAASA